MIATSHVIVGGTVGVIVGGFTQNPAIALVAGFVSHLICDLIPHIDHPDAPKVDGDLIFTRRVYNFAISDSVAAFLLTFIMWIHFYDFPTLAPYALGALGGYLPDFIDNVPLWRFKVRRLPVFKQFHELHKAIHAVWQSRFPMPQHWVLGTITQLAVVIPSLWYLFHN
ncbi:MAG: hypothetical protein KW793_04835 [Candidatus Doudnabacteria bacterium]|nr:hypothetical protein [Candidatus Doudnabacteria bacterium]